LKQTIQSFDKKGWIRSFTSKIFSWGAKPENQKILKDGYKIIRGFFPENVSTMPLENV